MKRLFASLALTLGTIGCSHAQVSPTNHVVDLSWTAPAAAGSWTGCTTASPCTYVISRITLAAGTTACPAANTSAPNYTPLNPTAAVSSLTYTDTAAAGLTVAYIAQTMQGSSVSAPSNCAGPFSVPASPLAPSLNGQAAMNAAPLIPKGESAAPVLTAKLTALVR